MQTDVGAQGCMGVFCAFNINKVVITEYGST